jgi:oligopeptide/dipeptide ABC transporter ATP-binding protein
MELGISSIPRTGDEKLTENVLEVEGLRVHFDTLDGPIEALHSVDLKVKDKQIMGLVGESGCGKSVTSLVTIGLATCDVDEGSVRYQGEQLLFSDSDEDSRVQDISGWIVVLCVMTAILGFLWTVLINPIQGVTVLLASIIVGGLSWAVGLAAKSEFRKHQKFMRWVRGNEISMIFQEPMSALNPLYTVEKQISEVMRTHDRLVDAETPRHIRILQALVSPFSLFVRAIRLSPYVSSAVIGIFAFVTAAHVGGFSDEAELWAFLLVIILPILGSRSSLKERREAIETHLAVTGYSVEGVAVDIALGTSSQTSDSGAQIRLWSLLSIAAPHLPLGIASSIVVYLMLWMPFSALMGIVVICTLLALPVVIILDYLILDPAHTRQVISILEDVKIPNPEAVVRMYPHELSGGMRQRVMIAMMMACEPKLLIADEPTTALDVTIQAQILKLMRDLRDEKGTAILLITHDLGVIAEMCDDVTVMYAGSVVETGSITDVLSRPRMPYSIGLLHSIPTIEAGSERAVLPIIPGQVPDPNLHFDGCRFHPRCPFADEKCISTPPPMMEVEPGHFAACHYTDRTNNVSQVQAAFDRFAAEYELEGAA